MGINLVLAAHNVMITDVKGGVKLLLIIIFSVGR